MIFLCLFVLALATHAGCWLLTVVSAFGVMRNFKVSSDRFSKRTLWNPLNALTAPSLLTETGLKWRRRVFMGFGGMLISLAVGGLSALCLQALASHG